MSLVVQFIRGSSRRMSCQAVCFCSVHLIAEAGRSAIAKYLIVGSFCALKEVFASMLKKPSPHVQLVRPVRQMSQGFRPDSLRSHLHHYQRLCHHWLEQTPELLVSHDSPPLLLHSTQEIQGHLKDRHLHHSVSMCRKLEHQRQMLDQLPGHLLLHLGQDHHKCLFR